MDLTILLGLTILVAFYMAWNIGANDVANTMGTSVGSNALTLKQAIIIASIFEFLGVFLVGDQVTTTIINDIVDLSFFIDKPHLLAIAMLGASLSTAFWLQFATFKGLPVSTTHSIIGAVLGFGIVLVDFNSIQWKSLSTIVVGWFLSPLLGGFLSFILFFIIKRYILESVNPITSMKKLVPFLIFIVISMLIIPFLQKSLPKFFSFSNIKIWAIFFTVIISFIISIIAYILIQKIKENTKNKAENLNKIEKTFSFIQPITACFLALGHGSNDVANAIAPVAAIVLLLKDGNMINKFIIPFWLLALGGFGIVVGLVTYGHRIIATLGEGITKITPTRGFSAEFGAAFTILLGSSFGLPLSSTQILVGCIIGVGFDTGISGLNFNIIKKIINSWIVTIPATAFISIVLILILKQLF